MTSHSNDITNGYSCRHPEMCSECFTARERIAALESQLDEARNEIERCNTALRTYEGLKRGLEKELSLQHDMLAALKHTVVATIGGVDYEGFPTSEINYLQRLRILVEKERRLEKFVQAVRAASTVELPRPGIIRALQVLDEGGPQ